MTVRPIRITGDPVLHTPAHEVVVWDSQLRQLVADMVDTMKAAPGVGLAAPQIGVGLAVFIWEWTDDDDILHKGVVINPSLSKTRIPRGKPDPESDLEGCLSVPDFRFALRRSDDVVLTGKTLDNEDLEVRARGWLARIFQHEFDHLQGTLYVDRLPWRTILKARREIKEEGWARPGLSWLPGRDDFEGSGQDSKEA